MLLFYTVDTIDDIFSFFINFMGIRFAYGAFEGKIQCTLEITTCWIDLNVKSMRKKTYIICDGVVGIGKQMGQTM